MQFNKILPAAVLGLFFNSMTAHATLTGLSNDGVNLVYGSDSNVTWTADGNLLGTLIGQQGFNTVVNAIIAASPIVYDTPNGYDNNGFNIGPSIYQGLYRISASDFSSDGKVDWWGAQAFAAYLNTLNNGQGYGGSNQWEIPTAGSNPQFQLYQTANPLGSLYYNELNGQGYSGTLPINPLFTNEQVASAYWTSTENLWPAYGTNGNSDQAWIFSTWGGLMEYVDKKDEFYAWAVSPGELAVPAPVPAPGAIWLFGSVLAGFIGFNRRKQMPVA